MSVSSSNSTWPKLKLQIPTNRASGISLSSPSVTALPFPSLSPKAVESVLRALQFTFQSSSARPFSCLQTRPKIWRSGTVSTVKPSLQANTNSSKYCNSFLPGFSVWRWPLHSTPDRVNYQNVVPSIKNSPWSDLLYSTCVQDPCRVCPRLGSNRHGFLPLILALDCVVP